MGKIFILSIGINNYPYISKLNCCVDDAELIYGNYSQFDCEFKSLLLNENASKEEILKSIHEIRGKIRDEDYFIFSFAGHGFTKSIDQSEINSKNSFICPYNFDPASKVEITSISLYELNEEINSLRAKSKLVFFDACHSGGALRKISEEFNLREIEVADLIEIVGDNEGTCIFTACDSHEYAFEDEALGHGIFTHNLIESLEELGANGKYAFFEDVYDLVSTKVRTATENKQNPKVKCSEEKFKVVVLPESRDAGRSEIQVNTNIIPSSSLNKSYEYLSSEKMADLDQYITQLIHEDRFIELDKTFKSLISSLFKKLETPDIEYSSKNEEAIPYYESCREYLKPLLLVSDYDINYYKSKCLMGNLDYILEFEKLCNGKNGNPAVIEIPFLLVAEFLFQIMTKAYARKDITLLKKITTLQCNHYGLNAPIIYHVSLWSFYMFEQNTHTFFEYLYNKGWIINNIFNAKFLEEMNELFFLFDCYSFNKDGYYFYPTYIIFDDFETLDRVTSKLECGELNELIEKLFSVKVEEFVKTIIEKLKHTAAIYNGIRYFHPGSSFQRVLVKLEELNH